MKKAFTLIELLVVIAIIAILAAILFPVFTQAKLAAKSTASLSNIKQHGTAHLIYAHNYDDRMVPAIVYGASNAYYWYGAAGSQFSTWGWNLQPYCKSGEIFNDPQTTPPTITGTVPAHVNQSYWPQYGYNYTGLSPATNAITGTYTNPLLYVGRSQDQLDRPADMVMEAARNTLAESANQWWYGPGTIVTRDGIVEAPDCNNIIPWCFSNWGTGSWYAGADYMKNNEVAGAFTGGVSLRKAGNAVVLFADGHAGASAPGRLADGTNWSRTLAASALTTGDKTKSRFNNLGDFF